MRWYTSTEFFQKETEEKTRKDNLQSERSLNFFWECWKAPVSDSGTKRMGCIINTKRSVSEVLSENPGSKMATVFFHSWRAPNSNKKENKSSSSKWGVRENLQTQNTHKDCQKSLGLRRSTKE